MENPRGRSRSRRRDRGEEAAIPDQHQRFDFEIAACDPSLLAWEIEDAMELVLMGGDGRPLNGYINTSHRPEACQVQVFVYSSPPGLPEGEFELKTLTDGDIARLTAVVTQHSRPERAWRGRHGLVVARFRHSVARLLVRHKSTGDEAFATAFLFDRHNVIATAAHVVDPQRLEVVHAEFGDDRFSCQLIARDGRRDIALLQLDRDVEHLRIRSSRTPSADDLGAQCVVIGYPNMPGLEPSVSIYELHVASLKRSYLMDADMIELSTHLGGGFSGAPVLDDRHNLLGLVVAYPDESSASGAEEASWPRWTPLAVASDALMELRAQTLE